ncbi:MFS transporter [Streptomyces purpureus]|uniref:MFS transporter n=1 Tax=Streptomyces purpureus TaxID=1951 RepID=A0A918GXQ5_9ACTN|nr:MFS transporter [Streptomyces purpureus]GGT20468.1 MFS transporter [Streptomyces purpureus]
MPNVQIKRRGSGDVRASAGGWPAVGAVTLGIFTVMTAELLPVGLLTPVGAALGVSAGTAGLMVTVPGLVAAAAAPLIAARAGALDRRTLLGALMALVAVANLASAVAGSFALVLGARVLLGVAIGGFWALAGGLATRLVPPARTARATAVIFGGVSAASVLGVPAATLAADATSWRWAFAGVGALALIALGCLLTLLPRLPGATSTGTGAGRRAGGPGRGPWAAAWGNRRVRVGAAVTFLLVTGHFTAYSFVRPLLADVSGVPDRWVGPLLLGYGAAGLVGNFLAGGPAARRPRRVLVLIGAALTAVLGGFALAGGITVAGAGLLLGWGLAYGGVSVGLQSWFLRAAPDAAETATGLYVCVFCLSLALGALIGGPLVDTFEASAVLWAGAALTLAAAVVAALFGRKHHA